MKNLNYKLLNDCSNNIVIFQSPISIRARLQKARNIVKPNYVYFSGVCRGQKNVFIMNHLKFSLFEINYLPLAKNGVDVGGTNVSNPQRTF